MLQTDRPCHLVLGLTKIASMLEGKDTSCKATLSMLCAQERLNTLQELYLRATRMCQGATAASALGARLGAVDGIIQSAMPQGSADACISELALAKPDNIVPALQQNAALRRERDMLRTQARTLPMPKLIILRIHTHG